VICPAPSHLPSGWLVHTLGLVMTAMDDTTPYLLQVLQDMLADSYGLSLSLWPWEAATEYLLSETDDARMAVVEAENWSHAQTLFQIIEQFPQLRSEVERLLGNAIRDAVAGVAEDSWESRVSAEGQFGWRYFVCPIAKLGEEGDETAALRRTARYALCAGPFYIGDGRLSWERAQFLARTQLAEASRALQNQLACELLEIPTKASEAAIREDARELRLVWNGIIREILPAFEMLGDSAELGYVHRATYVLFQHVRNSRKYCQILRSLWQRTGHGLLGAGIVLCEPSTGTAFAAFSSAGDIAVPRGHHLVFIASEDRVAQAFSAKTWTDLPSDFEGVWHLGQRCVVSMHDVPHEESNQVLGRVILAFESSREMDRHSRRGGLSDWSLFSSMVHGWSIGESSIRSMVALSRETTLLRKRNELASAVAISPFPEEETEQVSGYLERVLKACRSIVGYEEADYYIPYLHKVPRVARCVASTRNTPPEELELFDNIFRTLFDSLEPLELGSRFLFPVLAANRCLAILAFEFSSKLYSRDSLPLMAGLANQLGSRILSRRLLALLQRISDLLRSNAPDLGTQLADTFASLLSEGGCSIWRFSEGNGIFNLVGRVGFKIDLPSELALREASGMLIRRAVEEGIPVAETVLAQDTELRRQLDSEGFKRGIAIPAESQGYCLVVVLWSRAEQERDYFTDLELQIIRFASVVLLHYLRLERLVSEREDVYGQILAGIGHEVMAPLGYLIDSIKGQGGARLKHTSSLNTVGEYVLKLLGNFSIFAELDMPREARKHDVKVKPLFKGVIFEVVNVLRWTADKRRLDIQEEFEARFFPARVRLNSEEERYLLAILFNLIGNAIKYTYKGCKSPILITGYCDDDWVAIEIENDGIGVPEGEEALIFERHERGSNSYRTAPTSSGLGLFISRELARRLGGDLVLDRNSHPTRFVLTLPKRMAVWSEEEVAVDGPDPSG